MTDAAGLMGFFNLAIVLISVLAYSTVTVWLFMRFLDIVAEPTTAGGSDD